jgi:hypothetical protein
MSGWWEECFVAAARQNVSELLSSPLVKFKTCAVSCCAVLCCGVLQTDEMDQLDLFPSRRCTDGSSTPLVAAVAAAAGAAAAAPAP